MIFLGISSFHLRNPNFHVFILFYGICVVSSEVFEFWITLDERNRKIDTWEGKG